ncbi:MAG TPA: DNA repair protein RadC [Bacteroidota bacterium]|nr:DNA repair protein RadC [Bacteroidota bacterium]
METNQVRESDHYHTRIKDWPVSERPREKMIQDGPRALTDAELLAIFINSGRGHITAVDLGKKLLEQHRSLQEIAKLTIADFQQLAGIGQARAVCLAAAFELSRRVGSPVTDRSKPITSPQDAANRYMPMLRDKTQEEFMVVSLNSNNKVLSEKVITTGLLNSSLTHPREVFRPAILEHAASVILVHNHPSGNTEPSEEDVRVTRQIAEAGQIMGIPVHDHLIITPSGYTSFAERGLL